MTTAAATIGQGHGLLLQDLPGGSVRPLLDVSPFPTWIYDETDLRIVAVNGRALQHYGYSREQFLAMRVTDLEAGPAPSSIDRDRAGVCRHRRADGTVIAARLEASRIDVDGRSACLVVAVDVTEVLAESEARCRALAASEERYKQLFELAADWFWETDTDDRLTDVSPNAEAVIGVPFSACKGKRLYETEGVRIEPEAERVRAEAIEARRPYQDFVCAYKRRDGPTVWISTSARPLFDADGTYRGYRGIARNVTAPAEAERTLRERDRRFRQLFESATDWYWELDARGCVTVISPNFEAMYGIRIADRIGKRFSDVAEVTFDPRSVLIARAAIKAQQPYSDLVYSTALPNGKTICVRTSGIPMFAGDGQFCGYFGMSKDITAQVEADRTLRESEQQFKQLLEASADYYWEQDAQFRHSYISPSYAKLLGISVAEAVGKRLMDIPGLSVETEMGKMALRAHKAKQPYRDFVYSRNMPDGTQRWFKSSGAPIFDRLGVFTGFRGVGADITQHVEAGAAARLAQQRLHEAVAHVTQPIVVYDAEDRVVAYNQAFTDLHQAPNTNTPVEQGVSYRELVAWRLRFGFFAAGPDEPTVDLETLLVSHQSEAENTYRLRDGRWMLVVYRSLPGGGRVGLWTDVTALKRAEAERRILERQMHHSQRLEALGTLAGGVAHEINNALVPVIALTKMVAGKLPDGSRERRNLDTVVTAAKRSRDLVKQILAFSRKEVEGREYESVDLGAVLHEALRLMRATLPASIGVAEEIAPVPAITGAANQLHQVIVNLMTNAAHAIGHEQGKITVRLQPEADGAHLILSIADSGCGMDETTRARIFEPFFTTKQVGEGTGLGLSMVHSIVKDHAGRIAVESAPGQGTRFDIVLPLRHATAGAIA
jgi:PAS domain S-box-containing protein